MQGKARLLLIFLTGVGCLFISSHLRADTAESWRTATSDGSEFVFEQGGLHVLVRYYVPDDANANFPVVFVMPGIEPQDIIYVDRKTVSG